MKKSVKLLFMTIVLVTLISMICPIGVFAATSKKYSLRNDFNIESNSGPVWFYQMYQPDTKKYINLDVYKTTALMYVSNLPGVEWGGIGNGNWLPFVSADAAATFVAPESGNALITYDPQVDNANRSKGNAWLWNGGDGARVKIMKNGVKVWPTDKEWFDLLPIKANTVPDFQIDVIKGDKISFHVNGGPANDIASDNLNWWVNVELYASGSTTTPTTAPTTGVSKSSSTASTSQIISESLTSSAVEDSQVSEETSEISESEKSEENSNDFKSENNSENDSENSNSLPIIIAVIAVVIIGGGLALYLFKFRKAK